MHNEENCIAKLYLVNDAILCFSKNDALFLRSKRLVGGLVGSVFDDTMQNKKLSLPLKLSIYEMFVSVHNNLAKCYAPELKSKNEICDSAQLKNNEKEFFSQQLISLRKQKLSFLQENNIELTSHQLERCLDGVNSNFIYSPIDSWNSSDTKLISKEELWRIYFNNEKFVLNFLIFQDLWKRGYFLTCGYKFGGDFMLYKEDPVICHSTYIIICKHATEEITTNDISQICRIAVSVKKIAVFATCNPKNAEKLHYQIENANFDYQSITWTESV